MPGKLSLSEMDNVFRVTKPVSGKANFVTVCLSVKLVGKGQKLEKACFY